MKISITVVAYGLADDLIALYDSANQPNVVWQIFLHSAFPDVLKAADKLWKRRNVWLYDYRTNRGLANSWNEGLLASQEQGADVCMIANDDAMVGTGDVQRLADAALTHPDKYMISGHGRTLADGLERDMLFSLCVLNPIALEKIGYFDQNFFPIYFEDTDYYRRASHLGLERMCIAETNIVHSGSKTRTVVDGAAERHDLWYPLNRAYYERKWGGEPGRERYSTPFNQAHLGLKIEAINRKAPYSGFNRTDQGIVTA